MRSQSLTLSLGLEFGPGAVCSSCGPACLIPNSTLLSSRAHTPCWNLTTFPAKSNSTHQSGPAQGLLLQVLLQASLTPNPCGSGHLLALYCVSLPIHP